jgi:catechol 2,3-dioxygenase-like lactoylglutathione lyase family enzyme
MYGPIHLNVTHVDAHRRFWIETLGAAPVDNATDPAIARFPNVSVVMDHRAPTGGTKGTPVNHIAFAVPDIRAAVDRTRAAGYPIVTRAELPERFDVHDDLGFIPALETSVAFTMGPDEVKVEFLEVPQATLSIALHHIHFFSPDAEQMLAWYAGLFGAAPGDRGPFLAVDLPGGVNFTFSPVPEKVAPTAGRAIDRIGLVVAAVDECRRKLESSGTWCPGNVFTDPWGTTVEISSAA